MLNPDLDTQALAGELAETGRLVIRELLEPEAAQRIHETMKTQVPWRLGFRDVRCEGREQERVLTREEMAALSPADRQALRELVFGQARSHFQYLYQFLDLNEARDAGDPPGLFLYEVLDYMESADFLDFARALTGDEDLAGVLAHATRYTAGSFLKLHEDVARYDTRRFAYVLGLTPEWSADYGGLLHFLDDEGRIVETVMPGFNTLTVFRVPVPHLVSTVAPWVRAERLAITGWWRVDGED